MTKRGFLKISDSATGYSPPSRCNCAITQSAEPRPAVNPKLYMDTFSTDFGGEYFFNGLKKNQEGSSVYKARHLIENFFAKLKQFRAIATRYDKTARNFLAAIHLAAAVIWLN